MTLKSTTIRPGLLVGLKTSIIGNVSYAKTVLDNGHEEEGALVAKWETERRIADPVEHEAAVKVRGKARAYITAVCAKSAFGLLCPEDKTAKLEQAIADAQSAIDAFNTSAKVSQIHLYVISGRIAPDDVEAVRAINSELSELLGRVETGLANLDVKTVREAANRARSVGQMLSPAAQERVKEAIEVARSAARRIVQAGEQVAQEIDREAIAAISRARTAFLDLDAAGDVQVPAATARAVDFEPVVAVKQPQVHAAAIEVE